MWNVSQCATSLNRYYQVLRSSTLLDSCLSGGVPKYQKCYELHLTQGWGTKRGYVHNWRVFLENWGGGSTAKKNLGFGQLAVGRFFSFRSSEIFQKGCRNIFREKVVPVVLLNINLPLIIH